MSLIFFLSFRSEAEESAFAGDHLAPSTWVRCGKKWQKNAHMGK